MIIGRVAENEPKQPVLLPHFKSTKTGHFGSNAINQCLSESPQGRSPSETFTKKPLKVQRLFLWRWRESNPRPKDSTLGYTTSVVYLLI